MFEVKFCTFKMILTCMVCFDDISQRILQVFKFIKFIQISKTMLYFWLTGAYAFGVALSF